MAGLALDAGPLIAFDRGDATVRALLARVNRVWTPTIVPTPVLAQVWRGPQQAILARLLRGAQVIAFNESLSRRAGELLARTGGSDVVDAALAVTAHALSADVLTGDVDDLRRLCGELVPPPRVVAF